MRDITELFKSEGLSLYETLSTNDVVGFLVPLYQRRYSWDIEHVERMLLDVLEGMKSLKHDADALSFIGAAIFVDSDVEAFRSKAISIVDGQQRLTTAILSCSVLHQILSEYISQLSTNPDPFVKRLIEQLEERKDELFQCFAKSKVPMPKKSSQLYPILIREHSDNWGKDSADSEYKSPVANYLSQYINFVFTETDSAFSWQRTRQGEDVIYFSKNEKFIKEWFTDKLWDDEICEDILNNVLNTKIGSKLLEFADLPSREFISNYQKAASFDKVNEAIVILCYSEFFLRRLAITNVRVADERYGFDIFEALNTTGSPLTAIETFRPVVARYLDKSHKNNGGYERSDEKLAFDSIDKVMDSHTTAAAKTKESQKQVITFAYVAFGEKLSTKLDVQRASLKKWFERLPDHPHDFRKKYVNVLAEVAGFKKNFWDPVQLQQQLATFSIEQKEEALFHIDFIRGSRTEMAIPILLRYWMELDESITSKEFLEVCSSTAAFIAAWRAFTGNTGAIDSAFRSLLAGKNINGFEHKGVRLGKNLDNQIPPLSELKHFYVALLKGKKIKDKNTWIQTAASQPLYDYSQDLCRYLLLLAHHQAAFKDDKMVKNSERPQEKLNYKKLSMYRHKLYKTLEHIAPQNAASNWDQMFEKHPILIHTLGNLALLPTAENNALGNRSWEFKKILFKAFSEANKDKLKEIFEEADKQGIKFKESTIALLESGDCISMLNPLLTLDNWNHSVVKKRSANLLNCAWYELDKTLGFTSGN